MAAARPSSLLSLDFYARHFAIVTARMLLPGRPDVAVVTSQTSPARLFVVSELYYPEQTSTGYFITKIAESAVGEHEVHAICAQPTYASRGVLAAAAEVRHGVFVERCWSTRFDKNVLLFRVANTLTVSASLALRVLSRVRRGDQVLVVTTPPLLPFAVCIAVKLRRARLVILVHDVYPDVLVAARLISPSGLLGGVLKSVTASLYRQAEHLVVIGRDMADLVRRRDPSLASKLAIIPNWADTTEIVPIAAPESGEFVVQYSGNIGRTHALESLLEAAGILRDDTRIRFVISGTGGKRALVERRIAERRLDNVVVEDPAPRDKLGSHLGLASICVIAMVPGMYGVSVPSRMYNIMAAGKPVIAVVDRDSEVWRVVEEERIGWTVEAAASPAAIAAAIRRAAADPDAIRAAGARARDAAVARYSEAAMLTKFAELFRASV